MSELADQIIDQGPYVAGAPLPAWMRLRNLPVEAVNELRAQLITGREAIALLEYALHLRQSGERAPGGNETWREFDRQAEKLLRARSGHPDVFSNPPGYHPTCIETTGRVELVEGTRSFTCGPDCPSPHGNACTCGHKGQHETFHLLPCPIAQDRIARRGKPKPPPVGPGCTCDGSGRTCPRHGAVI